MNIKDGDILLCKSSDIVSRLIMWGTDSVYSHVAVVASEKLGLIIEAVPAGGVRAISIGNYKTAFDLYRVKVGYAFDSPEVTAYLVSMLARGYDFKSVVRLGWKMFLRKMRLLKLLGLKAAGNKKASDELQEDNDYFCSELCYRAFYEGGGLDIVPQVGSAETTSPGDIARSGVLERIDRGTAGAANKESV